ncbi:type IV fimbrial biogenesis protein FimT [Noviherbaspirillum humi]|uniref:Type II secretion system protein H n=1 Tax=Noviherbaspirillum humi TaxID=1688639 RepID=A0A239DHT2_9BURK|nr:GspH/FimT family pseudopilin [Noviherbaspirillum humi]SNS31996.1 type IV fimbrial biogenesis protein FimT [Noviherbaspirillum humi]
MLVAGRQGRRIPAAGLTMVEMLITVAVVAILLGVAVPAFHALIARQRIAAATSDLHAAILLARSEAIKRGQRVDLAPVGKDGDWGAGWAVFIDVNRNGVADAGDTVIQQHGALTPPLGLASAFTDSRRNYLAYQGSGRTRIDASD